MALDQREQDGSLKPLLVSKSISHPLNPPIIMEYLFNQSMPVLHKVNIIIGCIFFFKMSQYFIKT
jgi:hypothetical protein